jgi:hypothetical protein
VSEIDFQVTTNFNLKRLILLQSIILCKSPWRQMYQTGSLSQNLRFLSL